MKMIALAILALIQKATAKREGGELVPNTDAETLANRLALLIPEGRHEMLITGVPVKINIIDPEKCFETLAKRTSKPISDLKIRVAEITCDFDCRLAYGVKQVRYARTADDAFRFEDSEDYCDTRSNEDETYCYPFTCWKCDSVRFSLNPGQIRDYGIEIEYL